MEVVNNFGNVAGWRDHQFVLFGRKLVGVSKVSYKDSTEKEGVYGGGNMPIGSGTGNYKAECGLTLLKEEVDAIMASLPPGLRIQDVPPTDFPVLTMRNGKVTKDVIRNFQFTGQARDLSQGDKSVPVEMPTFCTHIDWNVE